MGTGTAIVHAMQDGSYEYIGGTGVGGGTLMGLSRLMLSAESISELEALADGGDLNKIDLKIKDLVKGDAMSALSRELTASNFANVSLGATKDDIALGIMNLVFETVGMVSIFAARSRGVKDVVLTGNVTNIPQCKKKYEEFNTLGYGVNFVIPERSGFATAIGAALIRAGKVGASPQTLAIAAGCTVAQAQHVLDALESGGFAMLWNETAEVWRIDTVQILAREERAALEALESATRAEKEQAATGIAKRKENAPRAQTGGKK
jgi:hypothetical protein